MSAKTPIGSNLKLFRAKKKLLKDFITNDPYLSGELGNYKHGTLFRHDIVFISITDGSHTADLFTGEGEDFSSAFASAMNSAEKYVSDNDIVPLWVKVDCVNSCKICTRAEFEEEIRSSREFFFKKGVSFDTGFETALLEAQLNCCGLINYKNGTLDDNKIRDFLSSRTTLESIPDNVLSFTTVGYICDENKKLYKLYPDEENYGRRIVPELTKGDIKQVIETSSVYLSLIHI